MKNTKKVIPKNKQFVTELGNTLCYILVEKNFYDNGNVDLDHLNQYTDNYKFFSWTNNQNIIGIGDLQNAKEYVLYKNAKKAFVQLAIKGKLFEIVCYHKKKKQFITKDEADNITNHLYNTIYESE